MSRNPQHGQRRGFTLVELLVVISIIVLLVGITIVVATNAMRSAESSATRFLMHSISDGLEQFHTDFGYYPPLLRDDFNRSMPMRDVLEVQPDSGMLLREYRFFSMTSLPVYLVGVGRLDPADVAEDSDPDRHDGIAGPGIRDPGADHSWGGALDRTKNKPKKTGRIYGPYVDLGDGDAMRPISITALGDKLLDSSPRGPDSAGNDELDLGLPIIVDSWGEPIRYYRPGWRLRDPISKEFTLEYTPLELLKIEAIQGEFKPSLDPAITNSEYFLLSGGPNRKFTGTRAAGAGGEDSRIQFEPMPETDTNTNTLNDIENASAQALARQYKMIRDNIRVTP
jgi:prepilin-type N-terminal cleavage/methylation domain-containing protein